MILLHQKLKITPNISIISEETVDLNIKNSAKNFWLIDPIDGTKEYIAGKDEYTLNAALVIDTTSTRFSWAQKNRLFYTFAPGESYMIENGKKQKLIALNNNQKESCCPIKCNKTIRFNFK